MGRKKLNIQNYEQPVSASELSNSEILVTMALLLRGSYSSKHSYISLSNATKKTAAKAIISNACSELGIPFENMDCDPCKDRYYLWGQELDKLLAKQCALPKSHNTSSGYRPGFKIPTCWFQLSNDRRALINNLVYDMARPFSVKIFGLAFHLPKSRVFANGLQQLLQPVNPDIEIRYADHGQEKPLLYKMRHVPTPSTQTEQLLDDISDLL